MQKVTIHDLYHAYSTIVLQYIEGCDMDYTLFMLCAGPGALVLAHSQQNVEEVMETDGNNVLVTHDHNVHGST